MHARIAALNLLSSGNIWASGPVGGRSEAPTTTASPGRVARPLRPANVPKRRTRPPSQRCYSWGYTGEPDPSPRRSDSLRWRPSPLFLPDQPQLAPHHQAVDILPDRIEAREEFLDNVNLDSAVVRDPGRVP